MSHVTRVNTQQKAILGTHRVIRMWGVHIWVSFGMKIAYGVATIGRLLKMIGLFVEYHLFSRALLQERPIILRSLLIVATPYMVNERRAYIIMETQYIHITAAR